MLQINRGVHGGLYREKNERQLICGLCAEAVNRHMNFYKKFRALRLPPNPTEELIIGSEAADVKELGFAMIKSD